MTDKERSEGCLCAILLTIIVIIVVPFMFWPRSIEGRVESMVSTNVNTTINFTDGRSRSFENVPPKPVEKGKYYLIMYNNLRYIYNVKEIDEYAP